MPENLHALCALREKRVILSGELLQAQRRVREIQNHLNVLDGAICLFDPTATPAQIKPKTKRTRRYPFHIRRTILGTLRKATSPMTAKAIAEKIATDRNMDKTDTALMTNFLERVRNSLSQNHTGLTKTQDEMSGVWLWRVAAVED